MMNIDMQESMMVKLSNVVVIGKSLCARIIFYDLQWCVNDFNHMETCLGGRIDVQLFIQMEIKTNGTQGEII